MVLFLVDPATSLPQALSILDHISTFSWLRVNWHKSTILPLGKVVCQAAFASTPLQRVSRVNYLGLTITNSVSDYFRLNVTPVISIFKQKNWRLSELASLLDRKSEPTQNETVAIITVYIEKVACMDPQICL